MIKLSGVINSHQNGTEEWTIKNGHYNEDHDDARWPEIYQRQNLYWFCTIPMDYTVWIYRWIPDI